MIRKWRIFLWLVAALLTFIVGVTVAAWRFGGFRAHSGNYQIPSQVSNELWGVFDDTKKVSGGVRSVLLETTQLSTSDRTKELSRSPLLEFQYDRQGRLIKETGYRGDGVLLPPSVYEYDSLGRLHRINTYNTSGVIYIVTNYTYDNTGRPLQAVETSIEQGAESVLSKKVFVHDPAQRYSEMTEYWGTRLRAKIGYISDEVGRPVEVRELSNMVRGVTSLKYVGKIVLSLGERGDLMRADYYDSEGRLEGARTYSYEYDSNGNWVKQTESESRFKDGKYAEPMVKEVYHRVITYY